MQRSTLILKTAWLLVAITAAPRSAQASCPSLPTANENEIVDPAMTSHYYSYPLPPVPGAQNVVPGGMQIDPADPNLFYVIDNTERADTDLRSVRAVRDTYLLDNAAHIALGIHPRPACHVVSATPPRTDRTASH